MNQDNRVVVLLDMDCFYCQVEEKLNPDLKGKPIAVVQYNPWKGGGIIAVNYVARAMGVTRHMRGDEAIEKCPEIELPSVPCQRGKADITKYREAGKDVARVLQTFTPLFERASIDEAYLDITEAVEQRLKSININTINSEMIPNTYALGYDTVDEFISDVSGCGAENIDFDYEHTKRLLVGAVILNEIRAAVYKVTGYRCSAGIAHNKILAKLVCGMNKPNKQTILPKHSVNLLYKTLSIKKVKHLGGKFGDNVCEILKVKHMADLQQFSEKQLQTKFDERNGTWLYNIARGIDSEPVQARFNPKSIGCCKQFKGKTALTDLDSLRKWLTDLGDEIEERLEKDALETNRVPKQMVVSFSQQLTAGHDSSSSRSYNFVANDHLCAELFYTKSLELLLESAEGCKIKDDESNRKLKLPIKFLGISVGKFEEVIENKKTKRIDEYFSSSAIKESKKETKDNLTITTNSNLKKDKEVDKDYVLKKFFNIAEISKNSEIKEESNPQISIERKETILQTPLDKQESFFAELLKPKLSNNSSQIQQTTIDDKHNRTPICNVVTCGDDSNDSNYSGSTINEEINKSIALFEEDPEDIARVSNMRNLLSHFEAVNIENTHEIIHPEPIINCAPANPHEKKSNKENIDSFMCECGKNIPIAMIDEHCDYHMALNAKNVERQLARKEVKDKASTKQVNNKDIKKKKQDVRELPNKSETVLSIANFLTKLDTSVPNKTCPECGKKVSNDRYMEHLDFHEAQKLSRLINNRTIGTSESGNSSGSGKLKRKLSTSPLKKPKVPCKTIDLFFR